MVIEKGIIKVVWITKNTKRIYSRMFDGVEAARKFGEYKKHYIIFRLIWHKKYKEYCWEVLPYGNYKTYSTALKIYMRYRNKRLINSLLGSKSKTVH